MRLITALLFILLLVNTACDGDFSDILDSSESSSPTSDTDDSSNSGEITGSYEEYGFDDQASMDFANAVLSQVNYARTDPAGYAEEYLKIYFDDNSDNGSYSDFTSKYSPMGALTLNPKLCAAADKYAKYQEENGIYEHGDFAGRLEAEGYEYTNRGENLHIIPFELEETSENIKIMARNFVIEWILDDGYPSDNAGHRINIMNSDFEEIGVGYYWSPYSAYGAKEVYAVQDFGTPK